MEQESFQRITTTTTTTTTNNTVQDLIDIPLPATAGDSHQQDKDGDNKISKSQVNALMKIPLPEDCQDIDSDKDSHDDDADDDDCNVLSSVLL